MPDTVRDLVTEALEELGVIGQGETASDNDADSGLRRYNRLLDAWNAEGRAVYADQFLSYTLTPALSPHTWGPTGTFVITNRPLKIYDPAHLWLGSSPDVKIPIRVRDKAWWNDQRVPSLPSSIPTDVYPDYTWPNASLYFWPVPSSAYRVELAAQIVLASVTLDSSFSLPYGYWRAHVLTLAEECVSAFGRAVTADIGKLVADAGKARAIAFGNNVSAPAIATRDYGMPQARGRGRRSFNYLSRTM